MTAPGQAAKIPKANIEVETADTKAARMQNRQRPILLNVVMPKYGRYSLIIPSPVNPPSSSTAQSDTYCDFSDGYAHRNARYTKTASHLAPCLAALPEKPDYSNRREAGCH